MAKKAMIEREKIEGLVEKYATKRAELKEIARNQSLPMEERFKARLVMPRNNEADAQPLPIDWSSAHITAN